MWKAVVNSDTLRQLDIDIVQISCNNLSHLLQALICVPGQGTMGQVTEFVVT